MNVIKNEKGTFVELPRESITFCGSTEQEKKANELIFDLSLEIDRQQQELERYKNIIDKIKILSNQVKEEAKEVENEWCYQVMKEIDYLIELKGE